MATEDSFSTRRQDACTATCAIIMNSNSASAFLPTVLVGGYGEGCIIPSLRLALAIAQNGPINLHPRLAQSGILIPVNDILRNALIAGERYPFSASLALVRFCGPHVTSTGGTQESGALVSIRESIRTATSVLMIKEGSGVDEAQLDTLRQLKVESILALEALSTNATLWSAISSYAVPGISEYLLQNNTWDSEDSHRRSVLCAALRTVQRVIPLPSHAVAAARAGIGTPLARLITGRIEVDEADDKSTMGDRRRSVLRERERREQRERPVNLEDDVQKLALEVLHTLASQSAARRGDDKGAIGLYHCGAVGAACYALGSGATAPEEGCSAAAPVRGHPESITKLGLEFLLYLISDLETTPPPPPDDPYGGAGNQCSETTSFVEAVARKSRFIRALVATMLLNEGEGPKIVPGENGSKAKEGQTTFTIAPLYGPPFVLYEGTCAGFSNPQQAATATLFSVAALCSSVDSKQSETFWDTFFMQEDRKLVGKDTKQATAAAACAVFLNVLMDEEEGVCVPRDSTRETYYINVSLPLVRRRLLEGLQMCLAELFESIDSEGAETSNQSAIPILSLLQRFHVPQTCLALCSSPKLLDPAFQIVESSMTLFSEELLPLIVSDKNSLKALFDLINRRIGGSSNRTSSVQIRRLICQILGTAADGGTLGPAVDSLGFRAPAVAALSAACLVDNEDIDSRSGFESGDDVDFDVNIPLLCLRSLVAIFSTPPKKDPHAYSQEEEEGFADSAEVKLHLSSAEAKAVSSTLGKKISDMVLARFMKRAHDDEESTESEDQITNGQITNAPEVRLLCALASSKDALPDLCKNGGLQALSLVATEGELSAIVAMHEACKDDPSVILGVEGHISVMQVLIDEKVSPDSDPSFRKNNRAVSTACLELLATLCRETEKGRMAVSNADECTSCVAFAAECIQNAKRIDHDNDDTKTEEAGDGKEGETDENEEREKATEAPAPKIDVPVVCDDQDRQLQLAAFSFLTELARVTMYRQNFLSFGELLEASSVLVSKSSVLNLQHAALNFLVTLAPYATLSGCDDYSASYFSSIFCSVLGSEAPSQSRKGKRSAFATKIKAAGLKIDSGPDSPSSNMILALAASGIECVFHAISDEEKINVLRLLSSQFIRLVDLVSFSAKQKSRSGGTRHSGLLGCNITMLFLVVLESKSCRDVIIQAPLMSAVLRLILLSDMVEDSKEYDEDEKQYWDAALAQCLQCLSAVMRSQDSETSLGSTWGELIDEAEKAAGSARAKKKDGRQFPGMKSMGFGDDSARRENLATVLAAIVEKRSNSVSSVSAQRILQRIISKKI